VAFGTVLVLVLCATPLVAGVVVLNRLSGEPGGEGAGAAVASPEPGDPPSVTSDWVSDRISKAVEKQAAALLGGDENGYLAPAEAGTQVSRHLRREFRTLRAMRVAKWEPALRSTAVRMNQSGEWGADLVVQHCFVTPDCDPVEVTLRTRWRDGAEQPKLIAIDPAEPSGDRPRPWETDELVATVGDRTLVAAPRAFRERLPELQREAERAAKIADRYAVDGAPPDRYLVFYAGPNEWKLWYGGDRPEWTAGYAVPVDDGYDLV